MALESAVVRWLEAFDTTSPVAASAESIPASWPAIPETPAGSMLRAWLGTRDACGGSVVCLTDA